MRADVPVNYLRSSLRGVAAALVGCALVLSCSPGSPTDPDRTQGSIQVTVSSSGAGVPPTYTVRIDGASAGPVESDGSLTISSLSPGNYEVELAVPSNCTVSGDATRTVGVQESSSSSVSFSVSCTAIPTGAIGVTTRTTGSPPDPDGYALTVDGGGAEAIGTNGTLLVPDLGVGPHAVELGGVAANCLVQGENPRTVEVSEDQTTQIELEIVCSATTGLVDVTVSTTGASPDPDGYSVVLDEALATQTVPTNGSTTFTGVEEGGHTVTLDGLATNCAVSGDNPVSVDVVAGGTADVAFSVSCAATAGDLVVSVSTTGEAIDADGYTVDVAGVGTQGVDANDDAVTFAGLTPGEYTVELRNVANNCTVTSANPATADVVAGEATELGFTVDCSQLTGDVRVNASTSGSNQDTEYLVSLDGGAGQTIGADGSRTFEDVVIGEHTVELAGVASNCAVQGENPRTVEVVENQTAQVSFSIECSSTTGQIQVSVTTTGEDLDPDGYTIVRDGGAASQSITINGTTTFSGVSPGSHTLELQNETGNCTVTSANPTSVNVTAGSTANASFTVSCTGLTGDLRVTTSTTGEPEDLPSGYTVLVDGSSVGSIGIDDAMTFEVDDGSREVELANVPSNCTVSGENPRTVNVPAGELGSTTFDVDCAPTTGSISVSVETTGEDQDDSYTVTLDGGSGMEVSDETTATFDGLDPDTYAVELTDFADNCTVATANPVDATVTAGGNTPVSFTVDCTLITGNLEVSTSTSGLDPDTDGYMVVVDGGAGHHIGSSTTETIPNVPAGSPQVELTGVATNCDVAAPNPRNVNVPANGTGSTSFSVTCTAIAGSIMVSAATSGVEPDPDGYEATLDGGSTEPLPIDGSAMFGDVAPGEHQVGLADVASNCSVAEDNPQDTDVTAGVTAQVSFTITCMATVGGLEVQIVTTGDDIDADGYLVTLVGVGSQVADPTDNVLFDGLSPATYDVTLSGLADNCADDGGDGSEQGAVVAGDTATVSFAVTCAPTGGSIVVTTNTTGPGTDQNGYLVDVDGFMPRRIDTDDRLSFDDVPEGRHVVALGSVDGQCDVVTENPVETDVVAGEASPVDFLVNCAA